MNRNLHLRDHGESLLAGEDIPASPRHRVSVSLFS